MARTRESIGCFRMSGPAVVTEPVLCDSRCSTPTTVFEVRLRRIDALRLLCDMQWLPADLKPPALGSVAKRPLGQDRSWPAL